MKRFVFSVVLTLILTCVGWAQTPPMGVVIQTWHYDPATGFATIRLNNVSGRDITAFNLSLVEKFADGTSLSTDDGTDFLQGMEAIKENPELGLSGRNGSFQAGTSYDLRLGGPGTPAITNVIAVVTVVAYADNTADVQDQRAFARIGARRTGKALALQKINDTLNQALVTSNPKQTALTELEKLRQVASVSVYGSDEQTAAMNSALRTNISRLSKEINAVHKNQTDKEFLEERVKLHEGRIKTLTPRLQPRSSSEGGAR